MKISDSENWPRVFFTRSVTGLVTRNLPCSWVPGTNVGWDMPIERLNAAIRRHVRTGITQAIITRFIESYTFLEHVGRTLMTYLAGGAHRLFAREDHGHRDVEADVVVIKTWLREQVGHDWAAATRVNTVRHVTCDASRPPWLVQIDAMAQGGAQAYHAHVQTYVQRMTTWAAWSP